MISRIVLQSAFQHLRFRGHDLMAFQVLDKNEIDFDFDDPILLLEDSETSEQMPVLPDVVMGGYRARMREHIDGMRQGARRRTASTYELITTDQPLDFALFFFLVAPLSGSEEVRQSLDCASCKSRS
jgi:hypothetical protein